MRDAGDARPREGRDIPADEPDVREELIQREAGPADENSDDETAPSVQRGNATAGGQAAAPVSDSPVRPG